MIKRISVISFLVLILYQIGLCNQKVDSLIPNKDIETIEKLKFDIHLSNFEFILMNLGMRFIIYEEVAIEGGIMAGHPSNLCFGYGLYFPILKNYNLGLSLRNVIIPDANDNGYKSYYCIMPSYINIRENGFKIWGRVGLGLYYLENKLMDFNIFRSYLFMGELGISFTLRILGDD